MCSKGGGSPPVPSAASTTFNSTTQPAPFVSPLYQDFLSRANTLSQTPFNPAMLGQVAPLDPRQVSAGNQLFTLGENMGVFDPNAVTSIMSPFTEQVVGATQNWFNNQNAIQGNDLLSQAIRSGNAFGGDRAGVAESVLGGQQQLAQAPVIAGLRQAGYTQALNEYNQLKQMGLAGAQAAVGAGGMFQQQAQRELDVAQQNAMMQSAYPFQTLNWYGSALGGIGPLLGQTAFGSNNPPAPNSASQALGVGSAAVGLGSAALGALGQWRGGSVHRARGGIVGYDDGGSIFGQEPLGGPSDIGYSDSDSDYRRASDVDRDTSTRSAAPPPSPPPSPSARLPEKAATPRFNIGQLKLPNRQGPQFPVNLGGSGAAAQPQQKSTLQQGLELGTKAIPLITSLVALSDPKTKTDVQRIGRDDEGEPLYGFRYRGDPKTYPKVVGRMAVPRWRGGGVEYHADGDTVGDDDQLTLTELGVLSPGGRELPPSIAGPARGSPGGLPQQAEDMSNLARVRERFRPVLENDPALRRRFDVNTTAEAGTRPEARDFYQALTLDRAAARGESLPYTLSRGPRTPDQYYPGTTMNARAASGQGVSPALWGGYNPANYGTGNASRDPVTGREVGFAGGPQTASIQTGSGVERAGIEGPDLPAARRFGYTGPSTTAIGPAGPQGTKGALNAYAMDTGDTGATRSISAKMVDKGQERETVETGPSSASSAEKTGSTQPALRKPIDIPRGEPTPRTFAQRWASNPFTQLGASLLAQRSPYFGVNLGHAMQDTIKGVEEQRKSDLLETKPEMVVHNGEVMWKSGNKLFPGGLPVSTAETRAAAAETRAGESHRREMTLPREFTTETPGPFGSTKTTKESRVFDERTGTWVPAATTPQPATPQIAPPAATPEPPAAAPQPPAATPPNQPAPNAPAVPSVQRPTRQTQGPTVSRPLEDRIAAAEGAAAGEGAPAAPAPQQQGQVAKPQIAQAQPPAAGGPGNIEERTQAAWKSGRIMPIGTVTNPGASGAYRNEGALEGLPPAEQATVKAVADYTADPQKLYPGQKNTDARNALINKVREYDQTYNPANLPSRAQAFKEFGVNGQSRKNLESNSMVLEHAGDLMTAIDKLNNYTYWPSVMNPVTGKWAYENDPKYQQARKEFETAANGVATEAAKTFRGVGSMSEREQAEWRNIIAGVYDSPVALRSALKTAVGMVMGRNNAIANSHNMAFGPDYERDGQSFLTDKARETIQRANALDPQKPAPPSRFGETPTRPESGPTAPVRVQSMDEARKLDPGTEFIIPDGSGRIGTVPRR